MTDYLVDKLADEDSELWRLQHEYFASITTAANTLLMITTGGKNWEEVWDLIHPLGPPTTFAFFFYLMFFTFALMNILTGIFVDQAISLAKPTVMESFTEQREHEKLEARQLRCLMEMVDVDGDGQVS